MTSNEAIFYVPKIGPKYLLDYLENEKFDRFFIPAAGMIFFMEHIIKGGYNECE